MMELGSPLPFLDIYYDLSYGRKPQVLLIIDIPPDVYHILQVKEKENLSFLKHYSARFIVCLESRPMADTEGSNL